MSSLPTNIPNLILRRAPVAAAGVAGAIGLSILYSWLAGALLPITQSGMVPLAAGALSLAGLSLWLQSNGPRPTTNRFGRLLASAVTVLGGVFLALVLERWLQSGQDIATFFSSLLLGLSLALTGLALLIAGWPASWGRLAWRCAFVAVVSVIYGQIDTLLSLWTPFATSADTWRHWGIALGLVLLNSGILVTQLDADVRTLVASRTLSGRLLRRMLLGGIVVVPGFAALAVALDHAGILDAEVGLVLAVTVNALLSYWMARRFERAEMAHTELLKREEAALRASKELLAHTNTMLRNQVVSLERRTRDLEQLNRLVTLQHNCSTLEQYHAALAELVPQLFDGFEGALYCVEPESGKLTRIAHWGRGFVAPITLVVDSCLEFQDLRPRVSSCAHSERCAHLESGCDWVCVPLTAQDVVLGTLQIRMVSPERWAAETDETIQRQFIATVADYIALSLANFHLRATLHYQSLRDPLTGLLNRRALAATLDGAVTTATGQRQTVGVIMVDIDHYKRFNDSFGHAAGDAVLRDLGAWLQRQVRSNDVVCRYGGEEFTLILPAATLAITRERAESIRHAVRDLRLYHAGQALGSLTLSLGVAAYPEHGGNGEAVLRAADMALYQAKRSGRNRVIVYDELEAMTVGAIEPHYGDR